MELKDIIKDILKEMERIKVEAHKDYNKNDMDKWLAVIGEEYGEMIHASNDNKLDEYYTESIQTISAIILSLDKVLKNK